MTYLSVFLFVLVAILGWFGEAQSQPSINSVTGTLNHGQSVIISGSSFGTKTHAAPSLWDTVDNISAYSSVSDGQAIPTGGSYPWGGNTYDAMKMETSDSMRHSNSSKMYKSVDSSKGNLGDLTLAKTNRLFIAYWWKPVVDPMDIGGSDKFVRAGEDSGMHFSWTQHQAYVYAPDYCGNTWRDTVPYPGNVNDWNLHEVLIDSSNLRYTIKVNGTLFYDNISWSGCSASMNYVGSIGWDANELY